jgi:hypothetical protein
MTKKSLTETVRVLFDELSPLESEDRRRAVQAVLTLLGETASDSRQDESKVHDDEAANGLSARARAWLRQNSLSIEQLQHTFLIENGAVELIATIPGKSNREKVRNAYVLFGISNYLIAGEQRFDDQGARALCEGLGIYDHTNHAKYLKGGDEFSGSRERGWILTPVGMKHGANLIASLAQ